MITILTANRCVPAARFSLVSHSPVRLTVVLVWLTLLKLFLLMCWRFLQPLDVTAAPPLIFPPTCLFSEQWPATPAIPIFPLLLIVSPTKAGHCLVGLEMGWFVVG